MHYVLKQFELISTVVKKISPTHEKKIGQHFYIRKLTVIFVKFEIHEVPVIALLLDCSEIVFILLGSNFAHGHQGVAIRASLRASLHPTA